MENYKCLNCKKEVEKSFVKRKIRCPYCGYKIINKSRSVITKIKAR